MDTLHIPDYLRTANFAATVCDREGVVVYQNERAIKRDGNVIGKNLYGCHPEKANDIIRHMIETGDSNTYEIIRHGKKKLIHQTPWYDGDGGVAGLIELAIDLPENMPVFDRDNKK
ncbi:MAG: PAS domain-containing protein [Bacteroidales bacterium]|nr:PAS domain-containing protein [Bacteroidales bacterium]MCM1147882.1 PAS domain-containing protein [Bacteroidales bacterium]MCM1206725.1 PAS domain-containing protein [Bacillota bacterium]MCM1510921.1 PAS domain-containing protein [Clostridium sp.]